MARQTETGCFYEFHRQRQPFNPIGGRIPRSRAILRLRAKQDIYTPAASDARSLAKDVQKGAPAFHGAHEEGFYAHFHPAFDHDKEYGHVFFGEPGFKHRLMQTAEGSSRSFIPRRES